MEMIELKNVCKNYGDKVVYDNFNLAIESQKITAVLGESGSGKTTLLNILAGITEFSGELAGNAQPVSFIFQKDRLIPNLTVEQNLLLVAPNAHIEGALKSVNMLSAKDLYPKQLSAGMARRVAILRAFLYNAQLLLMDEPFINLDIALKYSLIEMIKAEQKKSQRTTVFVTHDPLEAVLMADRIVVLKDGKIVYDNNQIKKETEKELFNLMLKIGARD